MRRRVRILTFCCRTQFTRARLLASRVSALSRVLVSRWLQGAQAQLIFYSRPDQEGPKLSDYHITLIENPADLKVSQ